MITPKPIWSVYIVRTVDNHLYSGVTTDVPRRFREHQSGGVRAAKYLIAHPPLAIEFAMPVGTRSMALKVEYHLKRLPRGRKEEVIRRQRMRFDPDSGRIALWRRFTRDRPAVPDQERQTGRFGWCAWDKRSAGL